MLNKYRLGESIIETTEERYLTKFKDMGYTPYKKEKVEPLKKAEVKTETKKKVK